MSMLSHSHLRVSMTTSTSTPTSTLCVSLYIAHQTDRLCTSKMSTLPLKGEAAQAPVALQRDRRTKPSPPVIIPRSPGEPRSFVQRELRRTIIPERLPYHVRTLKNTSLLTSIPQVSCLHIYLFTAFSVTCTRDRCCFSFPLSSVSSESPMPPTSLYAYPILCCPGLQDGKVVSSRMLWGATMR